MEKKEILSAASLEKIVGEIKDIVFMKFDALPEEQKTPANRRGIIFEELVKHKHLEQNPSIPRNSDPELIILEKIIIPLMERERLFTPDIIVMNRQNGQISIEEIGEIKLGFGGIKHARTQQQNFLNGLKSLSENFDEIIKRWGVVLTKQYQIIRPRGDCPLFYVLPQGVSLPKPEKFPQVEVYHSSFSYRDVRKIAQRLSRLQTLFG